MLKNTLLTFSVLKMSKFFSKYFGDNCAGPQKGGHNSKSYL